VWRVKDDLGDWRRSRNWSLFHFNLSFSFFLLFSSSSLVTACVRVDLASSHVCAKRFPFLVIFSFFGPFCSAFSFWQVFFFPKGKPCFFFFLLKFPRHCWSCPLLKWSWFYCNHCYHGDELVYFWYVFWSPVVCRHGNSISESFFHFFLSLLIVMAE